MKMILVHDCINAYPDYSKPFNIYTNASECQFGAAIIQEGCPIAYFSKKLDKIQQHYNDYREGITIDYPLLKAISTNTIWWCNQHLHWPSKPHLPNSISTTISLLATVFQ